MVVGRKHIVSTDPLIQRDFVQSVALIIEDAGFKAEPEFNRVFDLSFVAANGDRIAVECGLRATPYTSRNQIQTWVGRLLGSRPSIKETLVVNHSFPSRTRDLLDGHGGIEMVQYADLPKWLERYKRPKPKRKSHSARIASSVKANRDQILISTEVLALQIDDKITKLKDQKPNSPDAIDARDSEISDYEALRAQVEDLKKAVAKLTASAKSKEQAAKAALSFGDGVQGWWKKQHANILEKSVEMGLVLSAVGVCSLLGVSPTMAMAAATALVGGKSVAKALKGVIKVNA
jgi:hypothetical protein